MAGLAGKNGTLKIGAASYKITNWNISNNVEMLDDSNSKSEGKSEYVAGFSDADVTVDGYYDTSEGLAPLVDPGTSVTLILDFDGTNTITVPCITSNLTFDMPVKGKVTFNLTAKATGFDMATEIDAL